MFGQVVHGLSVPGGHHSGTAGSIPVVGIGPWQLFIGPSRVASCGRYVVVYVCGNVVGTGGGQACHQLFFFEILGNLTEVNNVAIYVRCAVDR